LENFIGRSPLYQLLHQFHNDIKIKEKEGLPQLMWEHSLHNYPAGAPMISASGRYYLERKAIEFPESLFWQKTTCYDNLLGPHKNFELIKNLLDPSAPTANSPSNSIVVMMMTNDDDQY
jgi:hypothetical protein